MTSVRNVSMPWPQRIPKWPTEATSLLSVQDLNPNSPHPEQPEKTILQVIIQGETSMFSPLTQPNRPTLQVGDALALRALTAPSSLNVTPWTYERLEILGDTLPKFFITIHVYLHGGGSNSGWWIM
ncbi:hypothetical protein I309_00456 [Cryptococcus deuterogattii LA55]|nr:hypothetical protein I309_00456 [Cryptococcus deuterogattii LA55]KIR92250.1 hypothetical protein I304_03654 [Cryptococcus deuterogattii CBS 10090]